MGPSPGTGGGAGPCVRSGGSTTARVAGSGDPAWSKGTDKADGHAGFYHRERDLRSPRLQEASPRAAPSLLPLAVCPELLLRPARTELCGPQGGAQQDAVPAL